MTRRRAASEWARRDVLRALGVGGAALAGASLITGSRGHPAAEDLGKVRGKTIGFTQSFSTIEWTVAQREQVDEGARKYGLKLIYLDGQNQAAKQVRDIEDLVTNKVDLIIIATWFAEAIAPAVREVNKAGIPIVVLSSDLVGGVDYSTHIWTDSLETGREVGRTIVQALGARGSVVQIEGKPGSVVNQLRGKGFREVLERENNVKIVAHAIANYERVQALKAMEDILQAHSKVDAVYAHNDDMALGVMQAFREAGRKGEAKIYGVDGIQADALQAILDGELTASWLYLPLGSEGVELAVRILTGQKVPKQILLPSPRITRSNVQEFYDPEARKRRVRAVKLPV
jgi:ribose transport system substrate-binding protein